MTDESAPLGVLLVEDSADDAELILRALRDGGLSIVARVVATEAEFRMSLKELPDVIISDWTLPAFSGAAALAIAHESAGTVPCILVSGTLGEDLVVAALQNGASGYVQKGRLEALAPAVRRALVDAATRRERARLGRIVEQSVDGILITDPELRVTYANPAVAAALGLAPSEMVGRGLIEFAHEIVGEADLRAFMDVVSLGEPWLGEVGTAAARGTSGRLQVRFAPHIAPGGTVEEYMFVVRDVTQLRDAEAELALETQVRVSIAGSLYGLVEGAGVEETAQEICDGLVKLPFIDAAVIEAFLGPNDVRVIGVRGPAGYPIAAGDHLPPTRAARTIERAAGGPWAAYLVNNPSDGGWTAALLAAGLKASAHGPIVRGATVVGSLLIGTCDARFARLLVDRMPAVMNASTTSSALLAERLHAMRREAETRRSLADVIAFGAFHPVFQPVVDLESEEVVGAEALTRFDSSQRPDLCFADAWSVGLGADLEIATLEAALAAAPELPAGLWLSLNISPRLLADLDRLRAVFARADRPLVVEITEHERVANYGAVREGVRGLGNDIRLAVDDAGSGVANFSHIVELRPDFVKLDIGLVRGVNADLGRQAMVMGMTHFSKTAGCRLIAEGIETRAEAHTLVGLGVDFGQGYLFGHPETVEHWPAVLPTTPGLRHATTRTRLARASRRTSEPKVSLLRQAPDD